MQTIFSIIIAFIISIGIFFVAIFIYQYSIQDGELIQIDKTSLLEKDFYTQNFEGKKIFIFGSSMVSAINATHVQKNLLENDHKYEVYNLAYGGNAPYRDQFGSELVEIQPKLLVYGISYRDFEFSQQNTFDDSFFPDVHEIVEYQLLKIGNDKFPLNPQFLIRTLIRDFSSDDVQINSISSVYHENTPFYPYNPNPILKSYDDVIGKDIISTTSPRLLEDTSHPFKRHSEKFLELFLEKMNDNSINVVLISTPLADISPIDNEIKNNYEMFLKKLEKKYDIKIFRFDTAYYGLDLWENKSHVSYHPDVSRYNDDVAKIILDEMK